MQNNRKLIIGLGAAAVLIVGVLGWRFYESHKGQKQPPDSEIVTVSTDKPSEESLDKAGYVWQGGPEDPKKITISSIGVDTFVQKVGVDQNKQVAVPTNINLTGWFTESVRPGEKGLSIIDGHFDGYRRDGVFSKLSEVKPGDQIVIEFGSGETKAFTAKKVTTLDTDKAAAELFSQEPTVSSQLNLITCGGNFNESNRSYDKRVILSASLDE